MNRHLLSVLTTAALLVPATSALAAPGDLDTSFSGDGLHLLDLGAKDFAEGAAIQPDGKLVVAGTAIENDEGDFTVARLNPDGSPDNSFSGDGQLRFSFASDGRASDDRASTVAVAPDGSIVVAGRTNANNGALDTAVARLTPGGALDASFNGNGKQTIDYGQDDAATDLAIRGDGTILVAGTALRGSDNDFGVARLTSEGQPDQTWSGDGRTATHFGSTESLRAIALTPDGGVVAVGSFQNVANATDTAIARYTPAGELDPSFVGGGKTLMSFGGRDAGNDVAVQPDGKLVLVGGVVATPKNTAFAARLTSAGAPDPGFGDDGVFRPADTNATFANALEITPDGRLLIAGEVAGGAHPDDFLLLKLGADGQPDRRFSEDGSARADLGAFEFASSLVLSGNRALVVGTSTVQDCAIAAFKVDEPAAGGGAPADGGAPQSQPAPEPGSAPQPAPRADTAAPVVSKLKLKVVRGTEKLSFRLSEPATVKVTVQRKVKRGRRTRLVAARTLTLKGRAGTNAVKVKKLKPGSYRLTLKATDAAGNRSKALRKAFSLKRKRR